MLGRYRLLFIDPGLVVLCQWPRLRIMVLRDGEGTAKSDLESTAKARRFKAAVAKQ